LSAAIELSPSSLHDEVGGTHLLVGVLQMKPVAQSASTEHLSLQTLSPHANVPQLDVAPGLHVPLPSQNAATVAVPSLQVAGEHSLLGPFAKPTHLLLSFELSHASALHTSVPPSSHFAREPCGAPETPVHLPRPPGMSHASHWPVQPPSQHTPSTQKPLLQSVPAVQVCPSFFTQLPASGEVASAQIEPAAHVASLQHTLPPGPLGVQCPLLHCVSSVQIVPSAPVVTQRPSLQP
jgi:hypothetical protein